MKKVWRLSGHIAFWLSYPLLMIYLRLGKRTRVLIIVDDEVLVVEGWLGAGHWSLPGGGLHRGEDPIIGALREVHEETGIKLQSESLEFLYETTEQTKGLKFQYYCFAVKLPLKPAITKQPGEIINIDWVPLKDISQANASPDTYHAVQAWLGL